MAKLPAEVKPDDPILASDYNALAEAFEAFLNLDVAPGGPLVMERGATGVSLALLAQRVVWAKLSGATSPYSWTEVEPKPDGTWATFGGRAGTADAYEINGKANLADKVVPLRRTSAGDWRFAWLGYGTTACVARICVTVNNGCASPNRAANGVTVTATRGGTTYGPCTTDASGQCCIEVDQAGSYTVTATVGTVSKSTTATAVCGLDTNVSLSFTANTVRPLKVTVFGCYSVALPGATVTVTQGGVILTGTTDSSGIALFNAVPTNVSTTVTATHDRFDAGSVTFTLNNLACVEIGQTLTLDPALGYHCACGRSPNICVIPAPNVLNFTDSLGASLSLVYDNATGTWDGSASIAYGGGGNAGCHAHTYQMHYSFTGCNLLASWEPACDGIPACCPGSCDPAGRSPIFSTYSGMTALFSCPPTLSYSLSGVPDTICWSDAYAGTTYFATVTE